VGYEASTKAGIYVPAKAPAAVVVRLNRELVAILGNPEVGTRFAVAPLDLVGTTPERAARL
jgi:tripartite-type tricarboxylate transporter receptor subunit TctC